jgi:alkylation response protein AidB-like acyl-CoA dehydrogenase
MAAKSMLYRVCWRAARSDGGGVGAGGHGGGGGAGHGDAGGGGAGRGDARRKELHALASAVKLVCSETAGRIVDRAVQIHGGRGYMREQPVERLWRELRVDRIWEGTSEIQRMVIGNELRKRGHGAYSDWA